MKQLLITTIAAMVLVGCGTSIYKAAKERQIEEVKKLWPSLGNSIRIIGDQFNLRRPKSVALRSTRTSHHANPLSHPRFPPLVTRRLLGRREAEHHLHLCRRPRLRRSGLLRPSVCANTRARSAREGRHPFHAGLRHRRYLLP